MPFVEDTYENSLIQLLQGLGYEHVYGPSVEERNYKSPLFDAILEERLRSLNSALGKNSLSFKVHSG